MNFYEQIFSRGRATGEGMTHFERLFAAKFGGSPPPEVREYTGAVPVTITADGTPLLDYLITGNTTQTGTPTPDNPIMPDGCGNKTANLFDKTDILSGCEIVNNQIVKNSAWGVSDYIPVEQGKYYIATNTGSPVLEYETIGGTAVRSGTSIVGGNYTPSATTRFIRINFKLVNLDDIMLNTGSTAKPFEPNGYKIPILSADTTTNVYLGEVETTRKIKKLVLTGEETWEQSNYGTGGTSKRVITTLTESALINDSGYCTHYKYRYINADGNCFIGSDKNFLYFCDNVNATTTTAWTNFLQQQYAAGTPVCVWYVLETETTGIVNEPLMKIGDYADTLSKSQAGVAIPTNNGSTTVDVGTTVKPSEIYIKYMG